MMGYTDPYHESQGKEQAGPIARLPAHQQPELGRGDRYADDVRIGVDAVLPETRLTVQAPATPASKLVR